MFAGAIAAAFLLFLRRTLSDDQKCCSCSCCCRRRCSSGVTGVRGRGKEAGGGDARDASGRRGCSLIEELLCLVTDVYLRALQLISESEPEPIERRSFRSVTSFFSVRSYRVSLTHTLSLRFPFLCPPFLPPPLVRLPPASLSLLLLLPPTTTRADQGLEQMSARDSRRRLTAITITLL